MFPQLARNTPRTRELREKYESGSITFEEYEKEESMEKNRISNIVNVSAVVFPFTNSAKKIGFSAYRLTATSGTLSRSVSTWLSSSPFRATYVQITTRLFCKFDPKMQDVLIVDQNSSSHRTNSYWVVTGIWWCMYPFFPWREKSILMLPCSPVPATSPRPTSTEGQ